MNLIPEVAKLLGVEIGEEFDIILGSCTPSKFNPYKFTEDELKDCDSQLSNDYINYLIQGCYTIRKIPFKPKKGDTYWYWSVESDNAVDTIFCECDVDLAMWKIGNCFRTKEEAETKGKELMEKIMKEYENE